MICLRQSCELVVAAAVPDVVWARPRETMISSQVESMLHKQLRNTAACSVLERDQDQNCEEPHVPKNDLRPNFKDAARAQAVDAKKLDNQSRN